MNVKKLLIFADERIKIYDNKIDKMEYKLNDINNLINKCNKVHKNEIIDNKYEFRQSLIKSNDHDKNFQYKNKDNLIIKENNELILLKNKILLK
jgi:hypothetical protein